MSDDTTLLRLEATLKDHEERIMSLEQRLADAPRPEEKPAPLAQKGPSIRQFMLEKAPTDDVQRTLVIGYYLEKHAEFKSFNAKDIEKGFVDAREKVPGNVSDKVLKNVWKGTMMQVQEDKDGMKAYVLTNAGTKLAETGFK